MICAVDHRASTSDPLHSQSSPLFLRLSGLSKYKTLFFGSPSRLFQTPKGSHADATSHPPARHGLRHGRSHVVGCAGPRHQAIIGLAVSQPRPRKPLASRRNARTSGCPYRGSQHMLCQLHDSRWHGLEVHLQLRTVLSTRDASGEGRGKSTGRDVLALRSE